MQLSLLVIIAAEVIVLCHCQETLKQNLYVGQSVKLKCGPLERYINIPMKFQWEKPLGNVIGNESVLNLNNVDFKDGGTYTCRATHTINDQVKENVLSTQLVINTRDPDTDTGGPVTPTEPPVIKFSDPDKDAVELTETQFLYSSCFVRNWINSDYVAKWVRYQRPINGENANLFVFPLDSQRDGGTYTCQIYHKGFPDQKYERELRVTIKKPELLIESLPGEELKLGGRISRKCQIKNGKKSDYEQMSYRWINENSVNVSSTDILNILITSENAGGEYTCIVNTAKGEKQYRERVQIKISPNGSRNPGTLKVSIFTQPMSPELNKPFQLSCQTFPSFPGTQYQWIKDGRVISSQQVLTLPAFQKSDVGSYSCRVNSENFPVGSTDPSSLATAKIEFMYSTENKIELFERGSQMISRVGEKRELHCEIPPNNNAGGESVKWYFNGREVDDAMKNLFNFHRLDGSLVSILSLLKIGIPNEGQYMCEVNGVRKSTNLIIVEEQSSMEINPDKLTKDEGQSVEFHCRVNNIRGFINSQITWTFKSRDGRRTVLVATNPRWTVMNNPNTPQTSFITTNACQMEDDGFYSCMTPAGGQRTAELTVKPRADNILLTLNQVTIRVRENEPVYVECSSFSGSTGQPFGDPKFMFPSGRSIDQDPRLIENTIGQSKKRLSIYRGLLVSDNGMKVDCRSGDKIKTVTIYVEGACPQDYRPCNDRTCLPSSRFCDGRRDCADGTDEDLSICTLLIRLTQETIRVRENEPITVECTSLAVATGQPMGDPKFIFSSGQGLEQDSRFVVGNLGKARIRLSISRGLSASDNGLKVDCRSGFQTRTVTIYVEGECPQEQRRCNNGACLPSGKFCDGTRDCPDGSDEDQTTCNNVLLILTQETIRVRVNEAITVECSSVYSSTGQPIGEPKFFFQFGRSLEQDPRFVESTIRQSRKRLSVPGGLSLSDNGLKVDCRSGYQTKTMTIYVEGDCLQNTKKCNDGTCLPLEKFCDGVRDCQDGSDEFSNLCNDLLLTITPEIVRVRLNQPIVIECFSAFRSSGEPSGDPKFTMEYGRSLLQDPRLIETSVGPSRKRVSIPSGLTMSDSGMKVECRSGSQTKTTVIYLETECPPNFRRCNNGECQPSAKFCDNVRDCSDGSDEVLSLCNICDPITVKCEYNAGRMPIKKTFLAHWRCDGENDCGNNYDESTCTGEDARCNGMNFSCLDGKVIPRAYQCDNEPDCSNNEDESGCVLPQITKTREDRVKRIRAGDSVKLACESASSPRSHVLWRHNWGCLKDRARMRVTNSLRDCRTVISVLTIEQFRPGDDGIYNCEALSAQNRAFSDDYQLILDSV